MGLNQQISIYENAKHWVQQYEAVDEVKDFIDKTAALEEYARRANDLDMEIKAARARVYAERRAGELLEQMEKAKGSLKQGNKLPQSCDTTTGKPKTLKQLGVSKDQSSQWQKLAKVPEGEFEEALNLPGSIPSSRNIIKTKEEPAKPINSEALWLWGRLMDIERKRLLKQSLDVYLAEMTEPMRRDVERILPQLTAWLELKK